MKRLTHRDHKAALECVRATYATLDLDAFPRETIAALRQVVRCPFGSYNDIDPEAARITYVVEPAEALVPSVDLDVRQYLREQPVISNHARTGDGSPRMLSDFMTRRQFRRTTIYNENYRRSGVEYQMTFMLDGVRGQSSSNIAIALDRDRSGPDFSEREREVVSLLRPHIMTAYQNAETVTAFRRPARQAGTAPCGTVREIIGLRRNGRHLMSARARRWLECYFPAASPRDHGLPEALKRWVCEQEEHLGRSGTLSSPPAPMVVDQTATRLSARLIPDWPDDLIVLDEEQTAIGEGALQRFGLTPREIEVFRWVAAGKTNIEIGIILQLSPRTAAKHLERIFLKLGVETRTAAAACVHE